MLIGSKMESPDPKSTTTHVKKTRLRCGRRSNESLADYFRTRFLYKSRNLYKGPECAVWTLGLTLEAIVGMLMILESFDKYQRSGLHPAYYWMFVLGILCASMAVLQYVVLQLYIYSIRLFMYILNLLNMFNLGLLVAVAGYAGHYVRIRVEYQYGRFMSGLDPDFVEEKYSYELIIMFNTSVHILTLAASVSISAVAVFMMAPFYRLNVHASKSLLYVLTILGCVFSGTVCVFTSTFTGPLALGAFWYILAMLLMILVSWGMNKDAPWVNYTNGVLFLFVAFIGVLSTGLWSRWYSEGRDLREEYILTFKGLTGMNEYQRIVCMLYEFLGLGTYHIFLSSLGLGIMLMGLSSGIHSFTYARERQLVLKGAKLRELSPNREQSLIHSPGEETTSGFNRFVDNPYNNYAIN